MSSPSIVCRFATAWFLDRHPCLALNFDSSPQSETQPAVSKQFSCPNQSLLPVPLRPPRKVIHSLTAPCGTASHPGPSNQPFPHLEAGSRRQQVGQKQQATIHGFVEAYSLLTGQPALTPSHIVKGRSSGNCELTESTSSQGGSSSQYSDIKAKH